MLKKAFVLLLTAGMLLSLCACGEETKPAETAGTETATTAETALPQEIKESGDLVGIWCVQAPWPENEVREFGEDLGVSDFTTTAKMTYYVCLEENGVAKYVKDFDLQLAAARDCYYTIFLEAFTEAKKVLDEGEFRKKIEDNYGYQSYLHFMKNEVPERYKDSPSHAEFFKMAYEELKKAENAPLEEQAALGSLWSEMLEEVGGSLTFADGTWQSSKEQTVSWSFENGVMTFNQREYAVEGNTSTFTAAEENGSVTAWTRHS